LYAATTKDQGNAADGRFSAGCESPNKTVGCAEERFVQAVRLASCDLNVKTGGGQGERGVDTLILTGVYLRRVLQKADFDLRQGVIL